MKTKQKIKRASPKHSSALAAPAGSAITILTEPSVKRPWPDPTPEMLNTPEFEAVWQCIKRWDINVPDVYGGYCGATGNHVRAILDALTAKPNSNVETNPKAKDKPDDTR